MLDKVKKTIQDCQMLTTNSKVVCATSGGVDSMCLLKILISLGYEPILAYVNHHKRKEADYEQGQLKNLAKNLHIPFETTDFYATNNTNFHSEAHNARYTFFKLIAKKYQTTQIATAHHLDDQIETIFMRLISGSNLFGYGGISPVLDLDGYQIVRPFCNLTKDEILNYAQTEKINYYEDSSNAADDYLRNRIRHHLVPIYKELAGNNLQKIQEFSLQAKEAFDFIRNNSIKYLDRLNNNIEVCSFETLDIALQKDILCLLFERKKVEKNNAIIKNCLSLIKQGGNKKIKLSNENYFVLEYNFATIKTLIKTNYEEVYLNDLNQSVFFGKYKFYFLKKIPQNNANLLKLCYNGLELPLKIRTRQNGDHIKMSYGNKKVSRLFIDAKISADKRTAIPLVFDAADDLLWVVNLAKSQAVINQKNNADIYLVCEEVKDA